MKKSNETFIKELEEKNPIIEPLEAYKGSNKKILCRCKKCGYEWYTLPSHLLRGHGCPVCAGLKKKTTEEFIRDLAAVNPNITVLGRYINSKTSIRVQCNNCGYEWNTKPNYLLSGNGCPRCANHISLTNNEFLDILEKEHPTIKALDPYQKTQTRIRFECQICGHIWKATPGGILYRGYGCPVCGHKAGGRKLALTDEDFKKRLKDKNPNIIAIEPYTGSKTKIKCQCTICGYSWQVRPNDLLNGRNCPSCSPVGTSFVEQFIYYAFMRALGENNVLSRDKTAIGRELDVYIPIKNLAIEYGAWFWHKNRVKEDLEKYALCKKRGITLIIIYDAYNGDGEVLPNIQLFRNALSDDLNSLLLLIKEICISYNIDFNEIDNNYPQIKRKAQQASRKMTTERFADEMKVINPNISILGEYTNAHTKIKCKCNICGTEWEKEPAQLRQGAGCPICSRKKASTNHHLTRLHNGANSLGTTFPEIAKEWDYEYNFPITPDDVTHATGYKAGWICPKCGKHFISTVNNRTKNGGKPFCPQCRRRTSITKAVVCVETKIVYASVKEAKEKTGCKNISSCLTGRQHTAGGYHWRYATEYDKNKTEE